MFLKLIAGRPKPSLVGDLFRIAPPRTCDDCRTRPAEVPAEFKWLADAIENGHAITMTYEGGKSGPAQRRITPRGLFESNGHLYLAARCHRDGIDKTYRLDRIREFRVGT